MKFLINILILMICSLIYGQTPYFSVGQDIKMAYEGPYKDRPNDIGPTFNLEFKFGFNWEYQRLGVGVETHNEINYYKYFTEFGHKFNNPFNINNITIFTGGEASIIHRDNQDVHYTKVNNFRENNYFWSLGTNIELLYNIPKTIISLSLNYNVFLAEDRDAFGNKIDKLLRQDVMFNIYLHLL